MTCKQPAPRFELVSPCPFLMTIIITLRTVCYRNYNFQIRAELIPSWHCIFRANVMGQVVYFKFAMEENITCPCLTHVQAYLLLCLNLSGITSELQTASTRIWTRVTEFISNYYHHHHVLPLARISLIPSRHFSLWYIASGRSSGLHPVSSHSCWMYVRAGRPAFARPYVGLHGSTSPMSSSLLP